MHGVQTRPAADIYRELDIHWVVHRIVQDQLDYIEVCAHWVPVMTKLIVWAFLVSIGHVILIIESSFGAETWLMTKPETRKRMCERETIIFLQQRKWKHRR